jgi:hypothetical protein
MQLLSIDQLLHVLLFPFIVGTVIAKILSVVEISEGSGVE